MAEDSAFAAGFDEVAFRYNIRQTMPQDAERFLEKINFSGECWLWISSATGGYPVFWLDGRMCRVTTILRSCFGLDSQDTELWVMAHRCALPRCVRLGSEHLRLLPQAENLAESGRTVQNWRGPRSMIKGSVPDRFRRFVRVEGAHWVWIGLVRDGEPYLNSRSTGWRASRVAWRLERGDLERGVQLRRTCEVPLCVAPEHHRAGNTACRRGHILTEENRLVTSGRVRCVECLRISRRKVSERRKAARRG